MSNKSSALSGLLLAILISCVFVFDACPESAEYYLKRGESYFEQGQYQRAITEFKKVVALTFNNADLYVALGLCYHYLGQYQEAIAQYQRAIEIDPEHANAYSNLGDAYGLLGQSQKEKVCLMKARKFYRIKGDRANVKRVDNYFKYLEFERYLDKN